MSFEVDKIHEDSFYLNMLLGLPKILDKRRKFGVKGRHLTRYPPTLPEEIVAWEKRYGISLPQELKKFYSATNGFLFKWVFNYGHERTNVIGKIEVNPLESLKQIFGYETNGEPGISIQNDRYVIKLGLQSKVFELAPVEERGKVVLVYINPQYAPSIWFMDYKKNFYFLTECFMKYFRMMIAHLGITCWQTRFTPEGTPAHTENMFRLLAPHLLPFKYTSEGLTRSLSQKKHETNVPLNKIDPTVFTDEYVSQEPRVRHYVPKHDLKMVPEAKKTEKKKTKTKKHARHVNNKKKSLDHK